MKYSVSASTGEKRVCSTSASCACKLLSSETARLGSQIALSGMVLFDLRGGEGWGGGGEKGDSKQKEGIEFRIHMKISPFWMGRAARIPHPACIVGDCRDMFEESSPTECAHAMNACEVDVEVAKGVWRRRIRMRLMKRKGSAGRQVI